MQKLYLLGHIFKQNGISSDIKSTSFTLFTISQIEKKLHESCKRGGFA